MVLKSASSIKTCGIMLHFLALFCFFVFHKKYLFKKQHIEIKPKRKKEYRKNVFCLQEMFNMKKERKGEVKRKRRRKPDLLKKDKLKNGNLKY